ncbi:MAG: hypothetical protein ACXVFQ_24185 [Solirubrobacteraceae bacterium]
MEIVRILEPYVARVIVVSPGDTGIAHARAKTDPALPLHLPIWVTPRQQDFKLRQTRVLRRGRTRAEHQLEVLVQNTQLTEQIAWLTNELHQAVCVGAKLAR